MQQSKVAVIGCGAWGKNLVRNFYDLGVLAMVCDTTPTGRATAKQLAPQAEVVSSIEAALRAPVAGLVIATPAETHYELVKQALEAGQDVFVEKPLALTYEQGAHLVRLAETPRTHTDGWPRPRIPSGHSSPVCPGPARRPR